MLVVCNQLTPHYRPIPQSNVQRQTQSLLQHLQGLFIRLHLLLLILYPIITIISNIPPMRSLFLFRLFCTVPKRKWIVPQQITVTPIQNGYFLVRSLSQQFVIPRKVPHKQLYIHEVDTPASILLREAIHILPKKIPQRNKKQKYSALKRKLQQRFDDNYKKCTTNLELFLTDRRMKIQMRNWYGYVGCIDSKFQHYQQFRSLREIFGEKTRLQYEKKGVRVDQLNATIYPKGEVWLPTSTAYLKDYVALLEMWNSPVHHCLDIGSGCGVLSFLLSKRFKSAKVVGIDSNPCAVETFNINAVALGFANAESVVCDVCEEDTFARIKKDNTYDIVVINPPWLVAKKLPFEGKLEDGVYDPHGKMVNNALKVASRVLKNSQARILLIYSDISKIIGVEKKSIEEICKENNLLIVKKIKRPFQLKKKDILGQIKANSSIELYEIKHSSAI